MKRPVAAECSIVETESNFRVWHVAMFLSQTPFTSLPVIRVINDYNEEGTTYKWYNVLNWMDSDDSFRLYCKALARHDQFPDWNSHLFHDMMSSQLYVNFVSLKTVKLFKGNNDLNTYHSYCV